METTKLTRTSAELAAHWDEKANECREQAEKATSANHDIEANAVLNALGIYYVSRETGVEYRKNKKIIEDNPIAVDRFKAAAKAARGPVMSKIEMQEI